MDKFALNKKEISFSKVNKKLVVVNTILLCLFFISQMFVTASLGTKSSEIQDIRSQKADLRLKNEILASEIEAQKAMKNVKDIATKMDLVNKNVTFLDEPNNQDLAIVNK